MTAKTLYVAITNHGFGHATRAVSVAATLKALAPEINIIFSTTAPQWLLASYFDGPLNLRQAALDVGVLQSDSVTMDKAATLRALQDIRANQSRLVETEVEFLEKADVDLVLGDIPPLVAIAAQAANLPCWMMSNFGWDFIYRPWGGDFVEIADWIADCFSQSDRLFRLPFHEPMSAFTDITDVGFTGGTPRVLENELRSRFNLTAPRSRTIMLTFGGLGLAQIPYQNLSQFPDWQFITFDRTAPDLPNLRKVSDCTLRPVDFMPLCGRVVSKPGYSTFSEAFRFDLPIVTITRNDFAEGRILVENLQRYGYHQILEPRTFIEGNWNFLREEPIAPHSQDSVSKTGNEDIAGAIANFLRDR